MLPGTQRQYCKRGRYR